MSLKRYLGIYLRGVAMGAADVVPGVSGGTVAFITGIYDELINTIKSFNLRALRVLFQQGPQAAWASVNGSFLTVLLLGILTSIISLAKLISWLLAAYPLLVWSLFFGLIAASCWHMFKQIQSRQLIHALLLFAGGAMAYFIADIKPAELPARPELVFMAGAISICAMILPGISGSFILVLLGMYSHILVAVNQTNWGLLGSFVLGAGLGLLVFSHILSWLLRHFHKATFSLLTGFLAGSLYLVWPWKQVLTYYQNSKGESLALEQVNVMPQTFQQQMNMDPQTLTCIVLMLFGLVLVLALEKFSLSTKQ